MKCKKYERSDSKGKGQLSCEPGSNVIVDLVAGRLGICRIDEERTEITTAVWDA